MDVEPHHLVGRSRAMHTRIDAPEVSAQHAALAWTGDTWIVRDLGSRNGTWLDGRRIAVELPELLVAGSVLWFGDARLAWTLTDASAPIARARCGDAVVYGDGSMLALPSEEEPLAVIAYDGARWVLQADDAGRTLADGEQLEVAGAAWVLSLPEPVARTTEARRGVGGAVGLTFAVSADQEYVEVSARVAERTVSIEPRAHHEALLTLARARVEDQRRGVSAAEQGWLYTADLARELGVSRNRLYVMLHRCRKDLEGLDGFEDIMERRTTTQQMRVAVVDLRITQL